MKLYAYGCPECGEWSRTCQGALVDEILQVLCPACGDVEHIEDHVITPERVGRAVA